MKVRLPDSEILEIRDTPLSGKPGDIIYLPTQRRFNMNLKSKYLTTGLILVFIASVGIFFPKFTDYLFWVTGIAGILSICWWTWKETR